MRTILEVLNLKRFNIATGDGKLLALYYPSMDEAQRHHPDAIITENNDLSHVEHVNHMIASADDCKTVERRGSKVYQLRFNTSAGVCLAMLFQDVRDGAWYDLCEYQLWKSGAVVVPVLKNLSTPAEFCKEFLFPKSEYTIISYGGKGIAKPAVLKGIRKFASVSFDGMCQCQLFLDGQDLYIKHNDYFSPTYCRPEDVGTPLSYRVKKYGIKENQREKFVYADNWGSIVLRRVAWIKVSNFVFLVRHLNDVEVSTTVWPMLRSYHHWSRNEYNGEWERFLEAVAGATRKYLNESVVS